eukprot:15339186-Ditylum_brightwellii.AAC.1
MDSLNIKYHTPDVDQSINIFIQYYVNDSIEFYAQVSTSQTQSKTPYINSNVDPNNNITIAKVSTSQTQFKNSCIYSNVDSTSNGTIAKISKEERQRQCIHEE